MSLKDQIREAFIKYNDCWFDGYEIHLVDDDKDEVIYDSEGESVKFIGSVNCIPPANASWFVYRAADGTIGFQPTLV